VLSLGRSTRGPTIDRRRLSGSRILRAGHTSNRPGRRVMQGPGTLRQIAVYRPVVRQWTAGTTNNRRRSRVTSQSCLSG
jgi:hypothetical protein